MPRFFYLFIGLLFCLALPAPLWAGGGTTFIVTRLDDPTPDGCAVNDCSLREAVIAANATTDTDTINFALDGTVELAIAPAGSNDATTGDLNITESLLLEGRGATSTIIDANQLDRVIEAHYVNCEPSCAQLTVTDLTITGGQVADDGGGIWAGYLTVLERVIVRNNQAGNYGGGVYGALAYSITHSAVVSNNAAYGGGIAIHGGSLVVEHVTVSDNAASAIGGGIATIGMPKILLGASARIENSTIVFNNSTAGTAGAGIGSHLVSGLAIHNIRPGNNIVAFNTGGVQCGSLDEGSPLSPNLTTDGSCETTFIGNPQIGPLADNGGATLTHSLGMNSPALDSGTCATGTDQRGLSRPVDLPGYPNNENGCDMGAYEAQVIPPTAVTLSNWNVTQSDMPLWGGIVMLVGVVMAAVVLYRRQAK